MAGVAAGLASGRVYLDDCTREELIVLADTLLSQAHESAVASVDAGREEILTDIGYWMMIAKMADNRAKDAVKRLMEDSGLGDYLIEQMRSGRC